MLYCVYINPQDYMDTEEFRKEYLGGSLVGKQTALTLTASPGTPHL